MKNGVVILPRNWVVILNWNQVLTLNWNWVVNITGICTQLIKNLGKKHQASLRYDVFDANTRLSGNQVNNAADLKYSTWALSYIYFFDENIKINVGYTLPINEKSANPRLVGTDFVNRDRKDNVFTIRLQATLF